jgi:aminoglycoside/choline kinase family phosphotransferase
VSDPVRARRIEQFLAAHGFALADATPLAQDASFRGYWRLSGGAVLMDAPPPEDTRPFLRIAAHLHAIGLSAPRIIAADETDGLVIEEDLGDDLFAAILTEANAGELFDAAIDALVVLHRAAPPSGLPVSGLPVSGLPVWGKTEMTATALGTLFDWWWPAMHGGPPPAAAREQVAAALEAMLDVVAAGPRSLVHRDYFAGNLIWLPRRDGPRRAGIIDFQSAAIGHPAYDLVSLLQDARRDIPRALEQRAINRYLAARPEFDPIAFRAAYAACAVQRHLRVACQWVRLAQRDHRPHYLTHGPRTWALLTRALREPAAAPLAAALGRWLPEQERRNPPGLTTPVIATGLTTPVIAPGLADPVIAASLATPDIATGLAAPVITPGLADPVITPALTTPVVATDLAAPVIATGLAAPDIATGPTNPVIARSGATKQPPSAGDREIASPLRSSR